MINIKIRFKNPTFVVQLILSFCAPMLAYAGMHTSDLNSWSTLFNVILSSCKNPYIVIMIAVSVYNCLTDPTTPGFRDSDYSRAKINLKGDMHV